MCSYSHAIQLYQVHDCFKGNKTKEEKKLLQSHSAAGTGKAGKLSPYMCTLNLIIQILADSRKRQGGRGIYCRRLLIQKKLKACNKSSWELKSVHIRNLPYLQKYLIHGLIRLYLCEIVCPLLFATTQFKWWHRVLTLFQTT